MTISDLIEQLHELDMPNAQVMVGVKKNGETVDSWEAVTVEYDQSRGPVYIEGQSFSLIPLLKGETR